jgi:hypothetical protein
MKIWDFSLPLVDLVIRNYVKQKMNRAQQYITNFFKNIQILQIEKFPNLNLVLSLFHIF